MKARAIRILSLASAIVLAATCSGGPQAAIEQLVESRRLAAELLLQLAKLTEAGNRTVMADSDDAAAVAVRESDAARAAIERDTTALTTRLTELEYGPEKTALSEFQKLFADLGVLDREILDLAALDTNLKAQRLSFGRAFADADALRDAVAGVRASSAGDEWQVRALIAETISAIREIQALQAPHIAEPEDAAMTRLEERMTKAESAARSALKTLATVAKPESQQAISVASARLDAFMSIHAEILKLSRHNSNVRSLALVLGRRRTLAAACEERLRAVQEALSKRAVGPTR